MITMMYASTSDGLIGDGLKLPWHISSDMKHFKKYTEGKTVVMGRKTADSLGKPLPNRTNIVLSREKTKDVENGMLAENGWIYIDHIDRIFDITTENKEIVIIGGAEIYELFEPYAHRILWTEVVGSYKGDVYFNLKEKWPNQIDLGHDPEDRCFFWELTR
jgi:dihydrofolate reductase